MGLEGNTKVGREQEALHDIISAVLGTYFCGLSLDFHQAWQFLFYVKRVSLILFVTHHTCLTFRTFILGIINPIRVAAVCVHFNERTNHGQVSCFCDLCCKWSGQLQTLLKYHPVFLCQVTCMCIPNIIPFFCAKWHARAFQISRISVPSGVHVHSKYHPLFLCQVACTCIPNIIPYFCAKWRAHAFQISSHISVPSGVHVHSKYHPVFLCQVACTCIPNIIPYFCDKWRAHAFQISSPISVPSDVHVHSSLHTQAFEYHTTLLCSNGSWLVCGHIIRKFLCTSKVRGLQVKKFMA